MDIGKRKDVVVIKRASVTVTGTGSDTETETTVATVFANKKPLNQVRALENGVDNLEGTAVFTILYYDYPTLDKTCRLVCDGITYTIHSIIPNEKVDFTVIAKTKS